MTRVSLGAQIDEVDHELRQRRQVYPRLVARGTMRQSVADYHMARMQAVRATLVWLQQHEDTVRAAVGSHPNPSPREDRP